MGSFWHSFGHFGRLVSIFRSATARNQPGQGPPFTLFFIHQNDLYQGVTCNGPLHQWPSPATIRHRVCASCTQALPWPYQQRAVACGATDDVEVGPDRYRRMVRPGHRGFTQAPGPSLHSLLARPPQPLVSPNWGVL